MCVDICFADIKFARHVTWIYWMNAEAETEAEAETAAAAAIAESVVTKSLYILYCSGCFIPFISFHFVWYFCLNLQSSKIHRCRARVLSLCLSLAAHRLLFYSLSFCCYSVRFVLVLRCLRSMLQSVSFSPFRLDSFSVASFYYHSLLLYSVLFCFFNALTLSDAPIQCLPFVDTSNRI